MRRRAHRRRATQNTSDSSPKRARAETQGQDLEVLHAHIDAPLERIIDWDLIEQHSLDLTQVAPPYDILNDQALGATTSSAPAVAAPVTGPHPKSLANEQPGLNAGDVNDARDAGRRRTVALLVEHSVVGQVALAPGHFDRAAVKHVYRVLSACRIVHVALPLLAQPSTVRSSSAAMRCRSAIRACTSAK